MKRILVVFSLFSMMFFVLPACKSKKKCATFDNPEDSHKANYNKKGLVKKKGVKNKTFR